jgi:hypothetical protein
MEPTQPTNQPESQVTPSPIQPNSNPEPVAPTPVPTPESPAPFTAPAPEAAVPPAPAVEPVSSVPLAPAVEPASSAPPAPIAPVTGSASAEPQIVIGGAEQPQMSAPVSSAPVGASGGKKKWLLPAVVVAALVVVLGGGYVFAFYLPNTPSSVYSSSLQNTGKAIDSLVDYGNTVAAKNYKSYDVTGSLKVKSSGANVDGTLTGSFDETGNATMAATVDVLGQDVNVNVRSIKASGNSSPDLYLQVSGIKSTLDGLGASSFDSLDGQWIGIDHNLIDTYAQGYSQNLQTLGTSTQAPTTAQVTDAIKKVQVVNKQYLFTTDSSKAVLTQQKYIGKETKNGRSVYHYKDGYNKDHLVDYLGAVKTALDSSSLNSWSKAESKQDLSQQLGLQNTIDSAKKLDGKYTFDLYADAKTKLVQSVQFADPTSPGTTFTVSQNYTGGDEYPFDLSINDKSDGQATTGDLKVILNKKTNKATLGITAAEADTSLSFDATLTPSDKTVTVTAPVGAQPIFNILEQLGLSTRA